MGRFCMNFENLQPSRTAGQCSTDEASNNGRPVVVGVGTRLIKLAAGICFQTDSLLKADVDSYGQVKTLDLEYSLLYSKGKVSNELKLIRLS
jgi:hypothetical protein